SLIIGARTEEHLRDNLAATELKLTEEQSSRIEAVTRRQPLYPYWHRFTAGIDRFDPAEQPFLAEHRKTLDARKDK
ncbi:putative short-chain dehydrogenase/oxidoreductase, partial [Pseudomonas fluorescens BRIP34879]